MKSKKALHSWLSDASAYAEGSICTLWYAERFFEAHLFTDSCTFYLSNQQEKKASVDVKAKIAKNTQRTILNLSSKGITVLPNNIATLQYSLQVQVFHHSLLLGLLTKKTKKSSFRN